MWKAVSSYRESSDPAFIVWRIEAKNVDGRKQTVYVRIDTSVVANEPWTTGKGRLRDVRDAMETQGTSVIEAMRKRDQLPRSIVYRSASEGFVEEQLIQPYGNHKKSADVER